MLTGGTISALTRVQLEKADLTELENKTTVIFHFETAEGIDGIHFVITKGTTLTFTASHDGAALSNMILYGKNATPSAADPVTFDLTK